MSKTPKIAFFGSPRLASECLESLLKCFDVTMIVSQPDRKFGRGKKIQPTYVSDAAVKHKVPLHRPEKPGEHLIRALGDHGVDLIVVVAYGSILPRNVINYPENGCLNLHASLLPKYRGPSPVQSALLNGETKTGVTVQVMKYEMDTGDILAAKEIHVVTEWNSEDLMEKIIALAPAFLVETITGYFSGKINAVKQIEDEATYCFKIRKRDGLIDWREGAEILCRRIKAYYSWPAAFSYLDGKMLKIYSAHKHSLKSGLPAKPGQVLDVSKDDGIIVQTGRGKLGIRELQLESKKRMNHEDFTRGFKDIKGKVLKSGPGN
ncbi:MAG TPA: methionyl-tRNA formyltransferase [Spirochaetes bacterium]|nr:methionyl-tRNA formyltransferase [Spirochaetota bacterium]